MYLYTNFFTHFKYVNIYFKYVYNIYIIYTYLHEEYFFPNFSANKFAHPKKRAHKLCLFIERIYFSLFKLYIINLKNI